MTIVDNNVLSALAKVDRFELLPAVFDEVATTPGVIEELDTTRHEGYQFVDRIDAVRGENGWLAVVTPTDEERRTAEDIRDETLSFVDAVCLSVSETRDRRLVTDDRHVGEIARQRGVDVWDLLLLLQTGVRHNEIADRDELERLLSNLEERDSYRFPPRDEATLFDEF